jgi:hypothetical protein
VLRRAVESREKTRITDLWERLNLPILQGENREVPVLFSAIILACSLTSLNWSVNGWISERDRVNNIILIQYFSFYEKNVITARSGWIYIDALLPEYQAHDVIRNTFSNKKYPAIVVNFWNYSEVCTVQADDDWSGRRTKTCGVSYEKTLLRLSKFN